ncbi:MAG TPA: hypothetical protein VE623_18740 [Acidimicrobiales bacterium]|nr:hypothetical protein [Acidimicrobiales bacterium]
MKHVRSLRPRARLIALGVVLLSLVGLLQLAPHLGANTQEDAASAAPLAAGSPRAPVAPAQEGEPDPCPPPSNIGTLVTNEYNGVPPSLQDERLVGPVDLVKTAQVDECGGTVRLPLYEGRMQDGTPVWYILTETNDEGNAEALGLNFAPKLTYADSPSVDDASRPRDRDAVRNAVQAADGTLVFDCGAVDFAPERRLEGDAFPPSVAEPGSVGDDCYTPLVKVTNAGGYIYNAPVLAQGISAEELSAFCEGEPDYSRVHDKVLSICPEEEGGGATGGTVTIRQTLGFSFARPVVYVSFESNDPVAATVEASTLTPRLGRLGLARDDAVFSAIERIFAFTNGPTGADNPQRQGLTSAVRGEGDPLNTFGGIPTLALDYSPLWDMQLGEWTQEAIDNGYVSRQTEEFAILSLVEQGFVTGPGGAPYGSVGIIINCPVISRLL